MNGRAWMDRGRCRSGVDPELFHPVGTSGPAILQTHQAVAFCFGGCPVRAECAEYAIATGADGVWGGLTEADRRAIVRERGITPVVLDWAPSAGCARCGHDRELIQSRLCANCYRNVTREQRAYYKKLAAVNA